MIAAAVFFVVVSPAFCFVPQYPPPGDVYYRPQQCFSQDECPAGYCCSRKIFQDEAFCVAFRQEGEICLNGISSQTLTNGLFAITCPCAGELKCLREEFQNSDGSSYSLGLPRCKKLGSSGSSGQAFNNANAFASGGSSNANAFSGPNGAFASSGPSNAFDGSNNGVGQSSSAVAQA